MKERTTWLSLYLLLASLLQVGVYLAITFSPEKFIELFYFDPRIGLFFIESWIRGAELKAPGILQWLSAIWLMMISLLFLSGRPILKSYLISEVLFSIPSLFFFVLIGLANLSPAHGFSVGELFFPVLVMLVFTVIPAVSAFMTWRKNARQDSVSTSAEQALGADLP